MGEGCSNQAGAQCGGLCPPLTGRAQRPDAQKMAHEGQNMQPVSGPHVVSPRSSGSVRALLYRMELLSGCNEGCSPVQVFCPLTFMAVWGRQSENISVFSGQGEDRDELLRGIQVDVSAGKSLVALVHSELCSVSDLHATGRNLSRAYRRCSSCHCTTL